MNPFQFRVACGICGGLGMGTSDAAAAEWGWTPKPWLRSIVVHRDPFVCAAVIRRHEEAARVNAQPDPVAP